MSIRNCYICTQDAVASVEYTFTGRAYSENRCEFCLHKLATNSRNNILGVDFFKDELWLVTVAHSSTGDEFRDALVSALEDKYGIAQKA